MASLYPNTLDSFATNRTDGTASATTHAADHDNENDAINKIEAELGLNPRGAYATVAARLTALAAANVGIPLSTVTAKGDLVVGTASGAVARLAVGTLGQILVSGQTAPGQPITPAWTLTVDAIARHNVMVGGTLGGARRAINLIPGSGVSLTANDDAANERVNVTITATAAAPSGPTIASFSPTSGPVGTSVVINGANFTGATAVKFNGVNAVFSINSSTQITTTVPTGATSGALSVTTPSGSVSAATTYTVSANYSAVVQTDNPQGYWRLGEASGTVALDSGSGQVSAVNNGTYSGGYTLNTGGALLNDLNGAVTLNGTTGKMLVTSGGVWLNSTAAPYNGDWTVEGWVRPNAVAASNRTLLGCTHTSAAFGIELANGYLSVFINQVANASATSTTIFPTSVYTHFAVTYVAATRTVTYYFNGVADGTATFTAGNVAALAGVYSNAVGATWDGTVYFRFFDGRIDEFAYYFGALTPTVIAAHFSAANVAPPVAGALAVRADFETGDLSQWWQVQCLNYNYLSNTEFTRGNAIVDTAQHGSGTYSLRIDLPASTNKAACEVVQGNLANNSVRTIAIGQHDYFGFESRFPTGWIEPGGWGATTFQLAQWPMVWASAVSFTVHATAMDVNVQTGLCAFGTGCPPPNGVSTSYSIIPAGQLTLNTWHQFIIHVKYGTTTADGELDIWWRRRGEATWNRQLTFTGPTLQWDSSVAPNPVLDRFDKIGFYHGPQSTAASMWHDNFVRGSTFEAISAALT